VNDTSIYSFYSLPTDGCHNQKGENVNHAGFDDAKRIYLIMIIIIKKGPNVNHAGFDDAKSIYLMKA